MNRQKGAWITIICILVIGVSVTKMTSRFVSSATLAAVETDIGAFPPQAGVPETAAMARGIDGAAPEGEVPRPPAGRAAAPYEAPGPETAAGAPPSGENGPGTAYRSAAPDPGAAASADGTNEMKEETAADQAEADSAGYSVKETVKSPLDSAAPGPGQNFAAVDGTDENSGVSSYTSEEYKERLDQTDAQIARYQDAASASKGGNAYPAAEYELTVWDNELNTLYSLIRSRMSGQEKEALKQEELNWMKERDAAADRAAAKAGVQTSKNTAYTEAAASKTKDRCYELLEDYGDVIDRGTGGTIASADQSDTGTLTGQ